MIVEVVTDRIKLSTEPGLEEYFKELSAADIIARKNKSTFDSYITAVKQPDVEYQKMVKIDAYVAQAAIDTCIDPSIPKTLRNVNVPWSIVLIDDSVENGWPHTHGTLIVLPMNKYKSWDSQTRVRTLVHERIHVFQRFNMKYMKQYTKSYGRMLKSDLPKEVFDLSRSNPDLDGYIYTSVPKNRMPENKELYTITLFNSDEPSSLADSTTVTIDIKTGKTELSRDIEHPYERMAYEMAEVIVPSTN